MLTGTQTAEHSPSGRSWRYGHASSAVLLFQTWVWPQVAAGQSVGDITGQPGPPWSSVVAA